MSPNSQRQRRGRFESGGGRKLVSEEDSISVLGVEKEGLISFFQSVYNNSGNTSLTHSLSQSLTLNLASPFQNGTESESIWREGERERERESVSILNVTAAITALLDKSCKCYERKRRRRFFKWRLQNSFLRSAFAGWHRERERERERGSPSTRTPQ